LKNEKSSRVQFADSAAASIWVCSGLCSVHCAI